MSDELNLGHKVQYFRKKNGLSIRDLAALTSLSPSMLSQIENNSVNPSINALRSVAAALNVPLFQFFKSDTPLNERIVRKGNNMIIGHPDEDAMYKLLTPNTNSTIEFCLMEIPAGEASSDIPRKHDGEEVTYVISGQVDLEMDGNIYHMLQGDSVQIPPQSPHRWVNNYSEEFKAVFAVTPPSF